MKLVYPIPDKFLLADGKNRIRFIRVREAVDDKIFIPLTVPVKAEPLSDSPTILPIPVAVYCRVEGDGYEYVGDDLK